MQPSQRHCTCVCEALPHTIRVTCFQKCVCVRTIPEEIIEGVQNKGAPSLLYPATPLNPGWDFAILQPPAASAPCCGVRPSVLSGDVLRGPSLACAVQGSSDGSLNTTL